MCRFNKESTYKNNLGIPIRHFMRLQGLREFVLIMNFMVYMYNKDYKINRYIDMY